MSLERFKGMYIFPIRRITVSYDGMPITNTGKIDLIDFAPYGEFISIKDNYLEFVWDEDTQYKKIVPAGGIEFMNMQDAGIAEHVAGRIRLDVDMDLLSRHHARLECVMLGYGGTWNDTEWIGKVKITNLDQPDWKVVDPEKGILTYGNLGNLEKIRNPEMIPYVVEFINQRHL